MRTKNLHIMQKKLLDILEQNISDPLTIREIQEALKTSSTSVVVHHMTQLEKKGYLKRDPYNPKEYQILSNDPESLISYIDLYGLASCSPTGTFLDDEPIDRIPIPSKLISFSTKEAFLVVAKGDSMEPRIHEGDIVIVRKRSDIKSGNVYVCVNDGEVLIKRVHYDSNEQYILHSDNLQYKPFISSDDFRVVGEVKGIFSRRI